MKLIEFKLILHLSSNISTYIYFCIVIISQEIKNSYLNYAKSLKSFVYHSIQIYYSPKDIKYSVYYPQKRDRRAQQG